MSFKSDSNKISDSVQLSSSSVGSFFNTSIAWFISFFQSKLEYLITTASAPSKLVPSSLKEEIASELEIIFVKSLTFDEEEIF